MLQRLILSAVALAAAIPTILMAYSAANRPEEPISIPQVVMINDGCSGFVGDFNMIVTARHCILEDQQVQKVKFWDGLYGEFAVVILGSDLAKADFAVLSGDTRGILPMEMTATVPEYGSICAHIGHGGASPQQLMVLCEVAVPTEQYEGYIVLHAVAIPGDSGSMVVNEHHQVFGILTRGKFPVPTSLAVKVDQVMRAIKALKLGEN